MKKLSGLCIIVLIAISLMNGQGLFHEEWHRHFESDSGYSIPFAVETDPDGNVIVAGRTFVGDTSGKNDAVIIKYNTDGDILWTGIWKYIEPGDPDTLSEGYADLVVDENGYSYGIIWMNSPTGHPHIYATTDIVIVKYDPNGNCVDTAVWDGEGDSDDMGNVLVRDPATGDLYVGGRRKQYDAVYSFDRWVVVKFDANLDTVWSHEIIPPLQIGAQVHDMTLDANGNLFATGYTSTFTGIYDYLTVKYDPNGTVLDSAIYDPGLGYQLDQSTCITMDTYDNALISGFINTNDHPMPPLADYDFYTIKYDNDLNSVWEQQYGFAVNSADAAADIVCDASGNVYVTGAVQLNNQDYDIFTIKYDSGGTQLWTNRYSGPGFREDLGGWIALDSTGNELYVVGKSCQTSNQYSNDYVLIIYDTDTGDTIQTLQYNGAFDFEDIPQDAAIDKDGNIFVTGYTIEDSDSIFAITTVKYSRLTGVQHERETSFANIMLSISPNPVRGTARISYAIERRGEVNLSIFDAAGRKVYALSKGSQNPGFHTITWDGRDEYGKRVASGTYYCKLSTEAETTMRKIIIIK